MRDGKQIPLLPQGGYIYHWRQRSLTFTDERDVPISGMRGPVASKTLRKLLGLERLCLN